MTPERGAACLLDVQEDHHVVSVHIELEVVVQDLLIAQSWIGQQQLILLHTV